MNARAEQLFNDKDFVANLLTLNADEAKAAIEAEGGEITYEELHEIGQSVDKLAKAIEENGGELTPEMLDDVSGGGWRGAIRGAFLGGLAGVIVGSGPGFICGAITGAYLGYKYW